MIRSMTIKDVLGYIENNLESKITIDTLVKYSGYGRRYLQLLFVKHIGMPLSKYIRYRKISRAALFLRLTKSSLSDISLRFNFDSQQTFNREFKKIFGVTPAKYRNESNWNLSPIFAPRNIDHPHPEPPTICTIDSENIYGFSFNYEEKLIERNKEISSFRWKIIEREVNKNANPTWILTRYYRGNKSYDTIKVISFIGTPEKKSDGNNTYNTNSGSYIHISFTGDKNEYSNKINNLYLYTLPYYGIKRRDDFEIEIIEKQKHDGIYNFNYYIPISME